ncbi:unnamed protein product [Cuscuta epithymum]|uniref:HAT C-terminal dimerisation domain-containing protein n=1 Tax=Cuscuta epithymum TaxID=186058 RepID=A0AAV0D6Q5_9ASTE|nr:unnamed protein product [Cuscuta epithymum]
MVEALVCTRDWLKGEEFHFYKEPTDEELEFYKELEELEQSMPNVVQVPPPVQGNLTLPPPPSRSQVQSQLPPISRVGSRGAPSNTRKRGRSMGSSNHP